MKDHERIASLEAEVRRLSAIVAAPVLGLSEASLAAALHEANVDCDYSRKFDRKACRPDDGPHSITARAILARLTQTRTLGTDGAE